MKGIRIGTGILATFAVGWAGMSFATAAWGALPTVSSGSTLSAGAWNDVVEHVNTLAWAMKVSGSNVGIGTTTVPSSARLEILHTSGNQLNPTVSMRSTLNSQANLSHYMNLAAGQTNPSVLNGDQALIFTNDASATAYSSYGLVIWAWSDKWGMKIMENGSVGIGTSSPQSTLHVVGNYVQIPNSSWTAPAASDCDQASEAGRMIIHTPNTGAPATSYIYICPQGGGWVVK